MQKNETGPQSYTIPQINSKWIKDLNVRPDHKSPIRRGKLLDISLGNDFLDLTPKPKAAKAKINKSDYIKLKMGKGPE